MLELIKLSQDVAGVPSQRKRLYDSEVMTLSL